jgi:D-glycero-alpha-D-manno-heptose-7-phosphate kinase
MIITRAPLRLTLGGGGTDLPSYYEQHGGFVFAMGIDQYVHIMVNRPVLDPGVRVRHTRIEAVDRVSDLEHDLARVALAHHGIEDRIEVTSVADLPGGTGLGSSGAFLVSLLAALHRGRGTVASRQALAEEACTLEMGVLGRGVGKQDQYLAAFGGLTVLEIVTNGTVAVRPVSMGPEALEALIARTHLYYTGVRRSAEEVLRDQDAALARGRRAEGRPGPDASVAESLHRIKDLGYRILETLESEDLDAWGHMLHEHWEQKKQLSSRVSLREVDALYEHVRSEYGVLGGKIAGAGGGGFLMLYCPSGHDRLESFMASQGMPRLHYGLASTGVEVLAAGADPGGAVGGAVDG